jgi:cytochrome c556
MSERKLITPEQIEKRAYELYVERGSQDGHDLENWLDAERQLTESSEKSSPEQSTSAAPKTWAAAAGYEPPPAKPAADAKQVPASNPTNTRR